MNFIMENWFLLIVAIAVAAVVGYSFCVFFKMPREAQLARVREWLLYAVAKAEKELGGGTGKLKLRYVYDMFIVRFGGLANIISFEAFSLMVDEVLEEFREMLEKNNSVAEYVNLTKEEVKE